MAYTVTDKGSAKSSTSGTTLTLSSVTLSDDSTIVVIVGNGLSFGGCIDVSSVTWNGISLTKDACTSAITGGFQRQSSIWSLHNVTGATGNVVVTTPNTLSPQAKFLTAIELKTNDGGIFATDTTGTSNDSTSVTTSASVTKADCIAIAHCINNGTLTTVSGDAENEIGQQNISTYNVLGGEEVHTTASGTLTATFNSTLNESATIAVYYDPVTTKNGSATLTGDSALTSTEERVRTRTSTLASDSQLTATGLAVAIKDATATLVGDSTLVASGGAIRPASVTLVSDSTLTATGLATSLKDGAATLAAGSLITATARLASDAPTAWERGYRINKNLKIYKRMVNPLSV